ncbi:MAG: GxxExxY protein [Planctomycetota bacterium]|nr:GxxExxY protein [Planctomycetota bacterium]MDA1160458.1 GxxExxY protein [Planctomycetota bacterium]
MTDIIYRDECYKVMGACFEVYKENGCGFVEPVYQECLALELAAQGIPFREQVELNLNYKGQPLIQAFKPDFICFEKIILEIKSVSAINDKHRAQVQNYLKATEFKLGLLVNFGHYPKVEWERIVR